MMPMKGPQGTPAPPLVAYCERHLPPDQAAAREASLEAEAEDEEEEDGGVGEQPNNLWCQSPLTSYSSYEVEVCTRIRQDIQTSYPSCARHRSRPRPCLHWEDSASEEARVRELDMQVLVPQARGSPWRAAA